MKKKYIFGPIPSRRLGMSLGVDLVPYKTCTLDCVYCECGGTTALTVERREYVPTTQVISELDAVLKTDPELDYITFSGAGEPTLHTDIGAIVAFVKENYPQYKMCLLTNATLLGDEQVREDIKDIDLIVPSLDAVLQADFEKVNRPSEELNLNAFIADLVEFKAVSKSVVWLEIFVVPGGNDSDESVAAFKQVVEQMMPDKVQINTLDRPGAVDWIEAPVQQTVDRFVAAMENIVPLEVVGQFSYSSNRASDSLSDQQIMDKVIEMISRRPCTAKDVSFSLSIPSEKVELALAQLVERDKAVSEQQQRGIFYRLK